jgi:hypothetical protein
MNADADRPGTHGARSRGDVDGSAAERVAVPDEDLTADLVEGFGAALSGDTGSRDTPGPNVEDDLGHDRPTGTRRPPGDHPTSARSGEDGDAHCPLPPTGAPGRHPGYPEGPDAPTGVGQNSPLNEGSEDTAVPTLDPAEHRPDT